MIEGLKPYAEYKESGLPWLGRCPRHWNVRRTKILFHERVQKGFPNEPLLAATQTKGVVKKEDYETRTVTAQKDLHLLKLVEVGDYVISLRSFQGGIEVAHCRGIISPAYTVLKPQKQAESRYYAHFFKAKPFIDSLSLFVTGIREGQNIDYERLSRAELPMPSEDEQAAIVRFLDHANRKIDGFIRAKRKLIGLLNEQKQAIIHRAVTGKDEVRRMKDEAGNSTFILQPSSLPQKPSGIPWLGDIPVHWEVRQLRRVSRKIKTGGTPKGADEQFFEEGGFNWHTPSDFRDAIELGDATRQLSKMGVSEVTTFPADTILMIGIGATIGKVAISRKPCSCNQQINAILPNKRLVHLDFLAFYLRTLRSYIVDCGKFTTMPIINQDETKRLPVLIPPLQEQVEIAKHIEQASKPFTTAIARTEREIALMQEYRTRLTADLVTGKLDVREAAAKLPEVLEPSDLSDESDLPDLSDEIQHEENA